MKKKRNENTKRGEKKIEREGRGDRTKKITERRIIIFFLERKGRQQRGRREEQKTERGRLFLR